MYSWNRQVQVLMAEQGCRSLAPSPKAPKTTQHSRHPALNQCHGRISSSISFIFHISGWRGEERRGTLSRHSSGHPVHRKPVACEGAQLQLFHMRVSLGRRMDVMAPAWLQPRGCPFLSAQLCYPLPVSVFSGYEHFWAHLLILTVGSSPGNTISW